MNSWPQINNLEEHFLKCFFTTCLVFRLWRLNFPVAPTIFWNCGKIFCIPLKCGVWSFRLDKDAEAAANFTTSLWLKQELDLFLPSFGPFDLQWVSCRPVYCISPAGRWIKFYKRRFSFLTCKTARVKKESSKQQKGENLRARGLSTKTADLHWSMWGGGCVETNRQSYHTLPAWVQTGHPCRGMLHGYGRGCSGLVLWGKWAGCSLGPKLQQFPERIN